MQNLLFSEMNASYIRQKGISLLISLLVLVLMSLAAMAMMRSLDSNSLAVGNMSFRQSAEAPIGQAIEAAMATVQLPDGDGTTANRVWMQSDSNTRNYYSFIQPGESSSGIPAVLQGSGSSPGSYPNGFQNSNDNLGNTVSYVIERMCNTAGKWSENNCLNTSNSFNLAATGTTADEPLLRQNITANPGVMFRVTVRVDGPSGARVFAQAVITAGT